MVEENIGGGSEAPTRGGLSFCTPKRRKSPVQLRVPGYFWTVRDHSRGSTMLLMRGSSTAEITKSTFGTLCRRSISSSGITLAGA